MRRNRHRLLPRFTALALALALFAGCTYKNAMKRGDEAMASGQYDDAIEQYERALAKKPDSEEARSKLAQAREKAVEQKVGQSRDALARGEFASAVATASEAAAILPDSPAVQQLIGELVPAVIAESERLTAAARFADAMALLDATTRGLPSARESISAAADATREAWVAALEAGATAAEQAGRKGDALLQRAQLLALTASAEAKAACDRLRVELKAAHGLVIAQRGRDAGFQALAPQLVGSDPVRWLQVLAPGAKTPEPRATLEFSLGKAKFTTDTARRDATARYQSGTKQVPNPFYEQRQRALLEQETRVTQAEQDVVKQQQKVEQYRADVQREGDTPNVSTGAEQNLYNAENRLESDRRSLQSEQNQLMQKQRELANTPQYQDEPVYETVTYPVTTHTLRASAPLRGAATLNAGEPLAINQDLAEEARDDEHSGHSAAGVAPDPLELPAKDALAQKLQAQALSVLEGQINAIFQRYRDGYRARVDAAASDDERVDALVIYTLLDPTTPDPALDATLLQLRGVPNASALLVGGAAAGGRPPS